MEDTLPIQPQAVGTPLHPQPATMTPYSPRPKGPGAGIVLRALIGLFIIIGFIVFLWKVIPTFIPASTESVTLTYWGLGEDEAVMKPVFADFQAKHPNITIEYTKQDPNQYRERLMTRVENGSGPDLFRFHNSWTPMLTSVLLPLSNEVISESALKNNYFPTVSSDVIRSGAILGVPIGFDSLSLFVNTDIFKAAGLDVPRTWDDFVNAARLLTVKDESGKIKTAGAAMGTYDNVTHASDIVSLLFVQSGVDVKNINANQQKAQDALLFYTAFAKDGVWDSTLDPSVLAFTKGNLAMFFGYSSDAVAIKAQNSSLPFQVYPVPTLSDRNMTIANYWIEGVSAKTKHPKEAFLLMKYLTEKDTLQKLFAEQSRTRVLGEPYPRSDMAKLLESNQLAYPFVSQGPVAFSTPFSSETHDSGLNAELNAYLGNAIRALNGNSSADTALKTLIEGQMQVVSRYGL